MNRTYHTNFYSVFILWVSVVPLFMAFLLDPAIIYSLFKRHSQTHAFLSIHSKDWAPSTTKAFERGEILLTCTDVLTIINHKRWCMNSIKHQPEKKDKA
jgi:hypothetical protein